MPVGSAGRRQPNAAETPRQRDPGTHGVPFLFSDTPYRVDMVACVLLRGQTNGDIRAVLLHPDDDDSTGGVGKWGDVVRRFLLLAITRSIALALEFEIPVLAHPDEVLDALDSDLIKICAKQRPQAKRNPSGHGTNLVLAELPRHSQPFPTCPMGEATELLVLAGNQWSQAESASLKNSKRIKHTKIIKPANG